MLNTTRRALLGAGMFAAAAVNDGTIRVISAVYYGRPLPEGPRRRVLRALGTVFRASRDLHDALAEARG